MAHILTMNNATYKLYQYCLPLNSKKKKTVEEWFVMETACQQNK